MEIMNELEITTLEAFENSRHNEILEANANQFSSFPEAGIPLIYMHPTRDYSFQG